MTNYFTHFSVVLPAPKVAERIQRVFDWYRSKVHACERYTACMDDEENPLVGFNFTLSNGEIWVFDEDSGDVEKAAAFIQEYLEDMDMVGGILMAWSNTCSDPYTGSGVLVTKDTMTFTSCSWRDLLQIASDDGVEIINNLNDTAVIIENPLGIGCDIAG